MKTEILSKIIKKSIKEGNIGGAEYCSLLDKTMKLKDLPVLKDKQELRILQTTYNGKQYAVIFVDNIQNELIAVIWNVIFKSSDDILSTKYKFEGWLIIKQK